VFTVFDGELFHNREMNKEPYTDFDLPTKFLPNQHYIPPRTRDSAEAERRHELPTGTLRLEQQQKGLVIANAVLGLVEQPEDISFITDILSISTIDSAWYGFGQHAPVMRRRLKLPTLAIEGSDWRQNGPGQFEHARQGLFHAVSLAEVVTATHTNRQPTRKVAEKLGRHLGNVSLDLACIDIANLSSSLDAFDVQAQARERSLDLIARSSFMAGRIGTNLSLAQLANPDSDLSVYYRRNAPDGAYTALEQAYEEAA